MMWLAFAGSLTGIALYLVSAYRFDRRTSISVTPFVQDDEHDSATTTD